jgi:hypothetical protein
MLTAKLCGSDGAIYNFTYLDSCKPLPNEPSALPTSAKNPYSLYACADTPVELAWNDAECEWDIVQVKPVIMRKPMLDIRCKEKECYVEKQIPEFDYLVQACECPMPDVWTATGFTGEYVDIPVDVDVSDSPPSGFTVLSTGQCSGCDLVFDTVSIGSGGITLKTKNSLCSIITINLYFIPTFYLNPIKSQLLRVKTFVCLRG